jgi:hypothetical protein
VSRSLGAAPGKDYVIIPKPFAPRNTASQQKDLKMLFQEGFTFRNFIVDAFTVFMFVVWLWLLTTVLSDLFRRSDVSGLGKAVWIIALVVIPYFGVFAYVISQSRGIAERNEERAQRARDEIRHFLGVSVADEIEKLDRLKGQVQSPARSTSVCGPGRFSSPGFPGAATQPTVAFHLSRRNMAGNGFLAKLAMEPARA